MPYTSSTGKNSCTHSHACDPSLRSYSRSDRETSCVSPADRWAWWRVFSEHSVRSPSSASLKLQKQLLLHTRQTHTHTHTHSLHSKAWHRRETLTVFMTVLYGTECHFCAFGDRNLGTMRFNQHKRWCSACWSVSETTSPRVCFTYISWEAWSTFSHNVLSLFNCCCRRPHLNTHGILMNTKVQNRVWNSWNYLQL